MKLPKQLRTIGSMILLLFLILVYLGIITGYSQQPTSSDFLKFYSSARFFLNSQSIYTTITNQSIPNDLGILTDVINQRVHPNLNPPFQTLLFSPLGLLSYSAAYWIWSLVSLTIGLLSVYLIFDTYRENFQNTHVFELSILFLLFFPTFLSIISGQFSFLLFFLLTLAWIFTRSKKDILAGLVLGIALSFKLFTGLFLLIFLIQRRWRLFIWYLGTFITCNLVALFVVGIDDHLEYLNIMNSINWYSASWNASFMGFFTRIFGGSLSVPFVDSPTKGLILIGIAAILTLLIIIWVAIIDFSKDLKNIDLVFSITTISMLLLSPLGWIYYFVILPIPMVVGWFTAKKFESNKLKTLLVVAWILCTIPYTIAMKDITPIDMFSWTGFPSYGLLLFFSILVYLFYKSQDQPGETNPSKTNPFNGTDLAKNSHESPN